MHYIGLLSVLRENRELSRIVLDIPEIDASWAEVEQMGLAIRSIRDSGKQIISFSESGNIKTLYLMSFASERYVREHTQFICLLPSAESIFFRDLLNKLGISVDVHAAGVYKSAGEMFSRKKYSAPARANLEELIRSLNRAILQPLGQNVGNEDLVSRLQKKTILRVTDLKESAFISGTSTIEELRQKYENEKVTDESRIAKRYLRSHYNPLRFRNIPAIAFLSMQGTIFSGKQTDTIDGRTIKAFAYRQLIDSLKTSSHKAVFIWMDSPGGSADASEILHASLQSLAKVKPLYVIFGSVAASGGYYLASAAKKIYTNHTSMTGSIGVIQIRPNAEGLLKKAKLHAERVEFYPTRDLFSFSREIGKAAKALVQETIHETYDLFLTRVAEGRKMEKRAVDKLAQGKVYSGLQAIESGLADTRSSIREIIQDFKREAGLKEDSPLALDLLPVVKTDLPYLVRGRMRYGAAEKMLGIMEKHDVLTSLFNQPLYLDPYSLSILMI